MASLDNAYQVSDRVTDFTVALNRQNGGVDYTNRAIRDFGNIDPTEII